MSYSRTLNLTANYQAVLLHNYLSSLLRCSCKYSLHDFTLLRHGYRYKSPLVCSAPSQLQIQVSVTSPGSVAVTDTSLCDLVLLCGSYKYKSL